MAFSAIIPAATVDAANATLEAAGWGPNNFSTPLRPNGAAQGVGGSHSTLNHIGEDAAFQAACAALPGANIRTCAPLAVELPQHANAQALEWTDPTNWFLAPIMTGNQKTYNSKLWESLVDFNVWEPPVAWREVVATGYPAWVQPTSAADDYNIGDRVSFNGQNWESTINGNVWSPVVYPPGWTLLT